MITPFEYHEATKHFFHRFANSAGFMDWANQPVPFRNYEHTEKIRLPFSSQENTTINFEELFSRPLKERKLLSTESLGRFFELSLGLSAWKSLGGTAWSLRMNPSSGNLHPTEAYIIIPGLDSIAGGIYHYDPYYHQLELRRQFPENLSKSLFQGKNNQVFFLSLSSIYWRESWKYGERAFRYCQHDIGHAAAALRFSACLQGWDMSLFSSLADATVESLIGFDNTTWIEHEKEKAGLTFVISCANSEEEQKDRISENMLAEICSQPVLGTPNQLSKNHADWSIIDDVSDATRYNGQIHNKTCGWDIPVSYNVTPQVSAESIIRKRRSAQVFDRKGVMEKRAFLEILDRTIPRLRIAPFDLNINMPCVHLFLFVHRIQGLETGLYCLIRNQSDFDDIQCHTRDDFLWERVDEKLALYLLKTGNLEGDASLLCCQQDIAGDSCFSVAMGARFLNSVDQHPANYRRLFWECGIIGQILYLCAEAYDLRGTGIGCYFDDPVHEFLGIADNSFQSLYHFTLGKPIIDRRLKTDPPYFHINDDRGKS